MIVLPAIAADLQYMAQAGSEPAVALARIAGGEIVVVAIVFSTAGAILIPLVRAAAKRLEAGGEPRGVPHEVTQRLERIESAVDSIALEVERISEGQRFVTQLLSKPDTPRISRGRDA